MPLHGTCETRCRAEGLCGDPFGERLLPMQRLPQSRACRQCPGLFPGLEWSRPGPLCESKRPLLLGGHKARETKRFPCLTACGDQPAHGGRTTVKIAPRRLPSNKSWPLIRARFRRTAMSETAVERFAKIA